MRNEHEARRGPDLRLTYIGGPTLLLELGGLRLLTDPTFDPAGSSYPTPIYVLRKTQGPAVTPESLGPVDAVLLSHDHHFDNLDHAGRVLLARAARVLTTEAGAARLGGNARGLAPWQTTELTTHAGRVLRVTGTPARHGPAGGDRGPVTGFVLAFADAPERAIYISGDTVWYDGVAAVAARFTVRVAVLFMGAARVREVGPAHLTLTADEAVTAERALGAGVVVPLHVEGWEHFSESPADVTRAFAAAGLEQRLCWLEPGRATSVALM
jgi:L-ascorbate metabolism protein UlaG (beta-lactamase superfamily)